MRLVPSLPEALLLAAFAAHPLLTPGTKVEESFTLHAVRDALLFGYKGAEGVGRWDHAEFAGAVPRSFIPPFALAAVSKPVLAQALQLGLLRDGVDAQVAIRLTLAFLSALSLIFLSRRVAASYGAKVAKYFLLLQATSFHVPFWAGRTVPNMLAFPLVQCAFALLVTPPALSSRTASPRGATKRTLAQAFALLTFAAVVIRLEIVALIVPFAVEHVVRGTLGVFEMLQIGIPVAGASIATSVAIDSLMWQSVEWLWPEGHAAWFNVVEGKSSEWGVSPFYFYLFPTLPRLLHLTLPFALFSLAVDRRTRRLLWPCIGFIALMSGLSHKEWRFIVYAVPAFFVAAAAGVVGLGAYTASPRFRRFTLLLLLALNALFTLLGLAASSTNYPGLSAVRALEAHLSSSEGQAETKGKEAVRVWVGVEAKMKGASNFALFDSRASRASAARSAGGAEEGGAWYLPPSSSSTSSSSALITFDKSESPILTAPSSSSALLAALAAEGYDYAIVDSSTSATVPSAQVVYQASEFGGFNWRTLVKGRVSWEGLVGARDRPSVAVVKVGKGEEA
ncbi:hypothetical protein JCM6882_009073 [Rhodosporidiobolus microsporus]